VSGNTADFNSDGFNVNLGCTLIGNTAGSNSRDGFEIGNGSTVVNNTAFANGRYGFLRAGGNYIGNNATLNATNVTGPADNAVNNVPSP
jgi:parallel beta-helix repeat protein